MAGLENLADDEYDDNKKTIVLDLDKTLIHSTYFNVGQYDFTVSPACLRGDELITYYVKKRPALHLLFQELIKHKYEIVVWSSAQRDYANAILEKLATNKNMIKEGLYRYDCTQDESLEFPVKDLSIVSKLLKTKLKNIIAVDDNPLIYKFQPENLFVVKPFSGEQNDRELWRVIDFCKVAKESRDIREALKAYNNIVALDTNEEHHGFRKTEREYQRRIGLRDCMKEKRKKIVVLEILDVLVRATLEPPADYDFIVEVPVEGEFRPMYVIKRPGLDEFLAELEDEDYQLIVFTSDSWKNVNLIVEEIDLNFVMNRRLYRDACKEIDGVYVKDLENLKNYFDLDVDDNFKNVVVVDCNVACYQFQADRGVLVKKFDGNKEDCELTKLQGFLRLM